MLDAVLGRLARQQDANVLVGFDTAARKVVFVWRTFADLHDGDVARQLTRPGLRVHCTNTIMRSSEDKVKLARTVLALLTAETAASAGAEL